MRKIHIILILLLCACQTKNQAQQTQIPTAKIIGAVEDLYIAPINMPFASRVDTGAQTSSIDAKNIKAFERDGNPWVSFDVINKKSGQSHTFKLPIKRITNITRTGVDEKRYVIDLNVKFANQVFNKEFSLNDRSKFEYQGLIGRNIINGNFIVDVSTANNFY